MALSKAEILAADDIVTTPLPMPEWGGEVFLRVMSGTDRDAFEAHVSGGANRNGSGGMNLMNIRAKLASLTLCDPKGVRLFNDAEVMQLGKKSGAALDRVFQAAQRINGMTDDDVAELGKNSDGDQND